MDLSVIMNKNSVFDYIGDRVLIKKIKLNTKCPDPNNPNKYLINSFYQDLTSSCHYVLETEKKSEKYTFGPGNRDRGYVLWTKEICPYVEYEYETDDGFFQNFVITPRFEVAEGVSMEDLVKDANPVLHNYLTKMKNSSLSILDIVNKLVNKSPDLIEDIDYEIVKSMSLATYLEKMHYKIPDGHLSFVDASIASTLEEAKLKSSKNANSIISIFRNKYLIEKC